MFCLVDYRNRPQLNYTFHSSAKAREYIRKIKNNPLGVTVIYRDGRREYFEHGLPQDWKNLQKKTWKIKRGFHIKYFLRKLSTLDGVRFSTSLKNNSFPQKSWRLFDSWPAFMLGNKKFYACLCTLTIIFSLSAYYFQKNYGVASDSGVVSDAGEGKVLGASFSKVLDGEQASDESALKLADENVVINLLSKIKEEKEGEFEQEILAYLKGKPMEDMAPYIAEQPRTVAAFIVGIAMKESKFGLYAPRDANGNDCHNYWGYRGPENTTASGYSCFATPELAVQAVGKRIAKLVDQGASDPEEMVVWKCGATCSWDNPENVRKWISDVGINFYKINS